ncbi:MAG: hypothetical protein ACK476_14280 [Fluviicola sp.]|jgi:hypothetical protein
MDHKKKLTAAFLLLSQLFFAQDSIKEKKVKILPVPAFGYSPETRTYLGAVVMATIDLYPDTITRTSNAKVEFNYTWNNQLIIESGWNYFFKEEKWFTKGLIHFSKFPDLYYGIGSETPDSNKLSFSSNRINVDVSLLKKFKNHLFVGLGLKHVNYYNLKSKDNNFSELTENQLYGANFILQHDNRTSLLTPTKGHYFSFSNALNFSKKNYSKHILDARIYKTWRKITFSNRFYNELNSNTPPFFDYAFLGGDKFVRGFYFGRFRDKHLSTLQTEVRFPVFWRIGLSTFGGISNLFPSFNQFIISESKFNAGIGLRFLVDKKEGTNLRFDYAIGSGKNSGFYISFGESF